MADIDCTIDIKAKFPSKDEKIPQAATTHIFRKKAPPFDLAKY
jgi:hypothetical protein